MALCRAGDSKFVLQIGADEIGGRRIPPGYKNGCHREDFGVESRLQSPLNATDIGLCCQAILCLVEQQRHVDIHAAVDQLFDGLGALRCARHLDEQIVTPHPLEDRRSLFDRRLGIGREQRRYLERDAAIAPVGDIPCCSQQVGGPRQVIDGEIKEDRLGISSRHGVIVEIAPGDGLVEDRRVARQPGHAVVADVASERSVIENVTPDVVEPSGLSSLSECVQRVHRPSPLDVDDLRKAATVSLKRLKLGEQPNTDNLGS